MSAFRIELSPEFEVLNSREISQVMIVIHGVVDFCSLIELVRPKFPAKAEIMSEVLNEYLLAQDRAISMANSVLRNVWPAKEL